MNLNREQIGMAVQAGIELLGPDSGVAIPTKLNDGIFFLKGLLGGIASGRIGLSSVPSADKPPEGGPSPDGYAPPEGNRKQRRAAAKKKRSKKVSKKKTTTKK